jgi:hypothetical protein
LSSAAYRWTKHADEHCGIGQRRDLERNHASHAEDCGEVGGP